MLGQDRTTANLREYFSSLDVGGLALHARALALELVVRGLPGDDKLWDLAYQLSRQSDAQAREDANPST
jgi:hypothetical protein